MIIGLTPFDYIHETSVVQWRWQIDIATSVSIQKRKRDDLTGQLEQTVIEEIDAIENDSRQKTPMWLSMDKHKLHHNLQTFNCLNITFEYFDSTVKLVDESDSKWIPLRKRYLRQYNNTIALCGYKRETIIKLGIVKCDHCLCLRITTNMVYLISKTLMRLGRACILHIIVTINVNTDQSILGVF